MSEPADIVEPSLIIKVNKLYKPNMSAIQLYEITRGVWVLADRRINVEFAFSAYNGIIKEVYAVHS